MHFVTRLFVVAMLAAAALPAVSTAQTPEAEPAQLDEVIVLARRSGAPMWTVTRGDTTLILVGMIRSIPSDVVWRPDALEEAAAQADLILLPQEGRVSMSDIFRVIWRARTIGQLPEGRTTADYLSRETQARLDALMAGDRSQTWRRTSLLFVGINLLQDKAGFGAGREGADAVDVVRARDAVRR